MSLWRDPAGRVSALKIVTLGALVIPGAWILVDFATDRIGPHPLIATNHQFGLWAIRFLFITLAITPLRQSLQWPRLIIIRRMTGVASFCYAAIHLFFYIADQNFALIVVASEIIRRFYLAIGFIALSFLTALAVTSTDGMVRRLGARNWRRLHQTVYGIAILASIHFFLQVKADVFEPTVMLGCLAWLMVYRMIAKVRGGIQPLGPVLLAILSLSAALATACGEAVYFYLKIGVAPLRIIMADFSLVAGPRPAWFVLGAGIIITVASAIRSILKQRRSTATIRVAPIKTGELSG